MTGYIRVTIEWISPEGITYDTLQTADSNEQLPDVERVAQCVETLAARMPSLAPLANLGELRATNSK